jgi:hypothetical protein
MTREIPFQESLVKRLREEIPGSVIAKADSGSTQGIGDIIILNRSHFASLEVKRSRTAHHQPNQDYYVNKFNNEDGCGAFIYPENEDEIVDRVKAYFRRKETSCHSGSTHTPA